MCLVVDFGKRRKRERERERERERGGRAWHNNKVHGIHPFTNKVIFSVVKVKLLQRYCACSIVVSVHFSFVFVVVAAALDSPSPDPDPDDDVEPNSNFSMRDETEDNSSEDKSREIPSFSISPISVHLY